MSFKFNEVVAAYVKLRDLKLAKEAESKAVINKITAQMEKLEGLLLAGLQSTGQTSAATPVGTAYLKSAVSVSIADWPEFFGFVQRNEQWDLLKRAASKEGVMAFKQANEHTDVPIPPGINWRESIEVHIQQSAAQRSAA